MRLACYSAERECSPAIAARIVLKASTNSGSTPGGNRAIVPDTGTLGIRTTRNRLAGTEALVGCEVCRGNLSARRTAAQYPTGQIIVRAAAAVTKGANRVRVGRRTLPTRIGTIGITSTKEGAAGEAYPDRLARFIRDQHGAFSGITEIERLPW